MIFWIMTILDLVALALVSLVQFKVVFLTFPLIYAGAYLIIKFFIFREWRSALDALCGIYIILVGIFHFSSMLYYLVLAWIGYKQISAWATI